MIYRATPQRNPLIVRGSEWKRDAACGKAVRDGAVKADVFFVHSGTKESAQSARNKAIITALQLCRECTVRAECDEESRIPHPGMSKQPEGTWAGMTELDRRRRSKE